MTIEEYLRQESAVRAGVHCHDGVWWKNASPGSCQPLYPLQEIPAGRARPRFSRSFLRYFHVVPGGQDGGLVRTRMLLQGERLATYSLDQLDGVRRKAIRKAIRAGCRIEPITSLAEHRRDLLAIYVSNAARNRYGLPEQWYLDHSEEWWRNLTREAALPGRTWFGAFLENKLVAFSYSCLVGDTFHMLVTKSHTDFLAARPVDLLEFEVVRHGGGQAGCRRIDAGWAIPLPPTIDWRKRSLGFEAVELPIFEKTNRAALGLARAALFCAKPLLDSPVGQKSKRGMLFHARTLRKRLENEDKGE